MYKTFVIIQWFVNEVIQLKRYALMAIDAADVLRIGCLNHS